ncbi:MULTISPECIES: extracellular solute-binding protein [Rhizobium/Agrobacterium group]|uniref:ABC transporter substrate-binding protein n=1 Tax=Rhizobium/Agrobacterium group TaxID=227290 RepID=UPI001ADD1326|nr:MULTISPECIES: extracellular solute-binding protein [Rhizobium/Agrobacterium group]MBO9112718.1 extracellular solute-binding protein [Agrobacterium sp. S2/73]QXZ76204.1 extracellular solute-binding protein [Agrobacterium sp. S7/73]QYA17247.1 extracellular solute-binding protein [Rhizobium sp. AB2/73]UEQ85636.1 extracellular solute-binding protein [Rhizobium sp. AB2/73]
MRMMKCSILAAATLALASGVAHSEVTLSVLIDNNVESISAFEAASEAYMEKHPDVTFDVELRPGGSEGDNIVKTRLATGEMADIFQYNTGSLFQALKPEQTMADVTDLPSQANVLDSFKSVVKDGGGKLRGIPFGPAMAGGIFYSRPIYAELGLTPPKTWAEFMANNEKIKAAGKVALAQTYGTTWTSQLMILGDFHNVQAEVPNFAADYTANKAKYATTPAALRGFEHLEEVAKAGIFNADFGAATYEEGMHMVAAGEAAHYPTITSGLGSVRENYPDLLNNLGFFGQPGIDASKNGLTVWMPAALYISSKSDHAEEAKKFVDWMGTKEACKIMAKVVPSGPYLIKDCQLPADIPPAVADMLPYFQTEGRATPALEFLSPVKGPALEQITVEVGTGIRPAKEAAALYDQDVQKQAKQLGLPNW